jgi:hypothetical protein
MHRDEGEDLARRLNLRFFRTSAKDNINIDEGEYNEEILMKIFKT